MDELSQLDELIESDILEALGQEVTENLEKEESIKIEDLDNESVSEEEEITLQDIDIVENKSTIEEEITLEDLEEPAEVSAQEDLPVIEKDDTIQKIDTAISSNDLGSLLSQLLTNKTIEITIKIKD